MSPLRQFIHILAKDVRAHAPEIAIVLLLNLFAVAVMTKPWTEYLVPGESDTASVTSVLMIVAWCLLIARVVQGEELIGRLPYWLTRPYSRGALLAAKLAFVLLFVHLPTFLAQLAIVIGSGVPLSVSQLLLNQIVFFAGVSLPAAAIAALTSSLTRFVIVAVTSTAIALLVIAATISQRSILLDNSIPLLGDLSTFEQTVELTLLAVIASAALVCQYRWRSTVRIASVSLTALAILAATMLLLTPQMIQSARTVVLGIPTVAPTIRLRETTERFGNPLLVADTSMVVSIFLPFELPATDDVAFRHVELTLRTADERDLMIAGARLIGTADDLWLTLSMSRVLYDSLKDSTVSLHLVTEIETYRARDTGPLTLDGSPTVADGRAQCWLWSTNPILCRTSFGASPWFVHVPRWEPLRMEPPAVRFVINPIVTLSSIRLSDPAADLSSITTSVREHLSYVRQVMTFENIRLGDFGPP